MAEAIAYLKRIKDTAFTFVLRHLIHTVTEHRHLYTIGKCYIIHKLFSILLNLGASSDIPNIYLVGDTFGLSLVGNKYFNLPVDWWGGSVA